jgi:ABC-type multidrug transport system fused ATPase/permease subunit
LCFYIFVWILEFHIRKWDQPATFIFLNNLEKKYRSKILLKSGKEFESKGTGFVQSVVEGGMQNWSDGAHAILFQIPRVLITFGVGIYVSAKVSLVFVLSYLLPLIFVISFASWLRRKKLVYSEKANDIANIRNALSVRSIMSRQEIVFAGKEKDEVKNISELILKQRQIELDGHKYQYFSEVVIDAAGILLPFIIAASFVLFADMSTLDSVFMVAFIFFASRLTFAIWQIMYLINEFLIKYPKVKKLWQFLDETPEIKNYETGKMFEHKNGEIILENIFFTYGKEEIKN